MAWNGNESEGYGFTKAEKPWLPYATHSQEINVENEKKTEKSVLGYYQKLLALRAKNPTLRRGEFSEIRNDENCFIYTRKYGDETLLIVCNFEKQTQIKVFASGEKILGNYPSENTEINREYAPFETAIYKIR
jgi:glycosidase